MDVEGDINLTIGAISFRAPETSEYLEIALKLLEIRRRELSSDPIQSDTERTVEASDLGNERLELIRPLTRVSQTSRRNRWFKDQYPRITLSDGVIRTLNSLEELRDLLRRNGLQPHTRGDASMLLWQVRNRLGYSVEAVAEPYSESL